jgi:hypothetical protein
MNIELMRKHAVNAKPLMLRLWHNEKKRITLTADEAYMVADFYINTIEFLNSIESSHDIAEATQCKRSMS